MAEQNRLPRMDLHCHLDGSLSRDVFKSFWEEV